MTSMTTAERKQAHRAENTKTIQIAARPLFEADGYAITAIEKIARSAGVSVGAVYLYFKSKEDVYLSLLPEWLAPLVVDIHATKSMPKAWMALWAWGQRNPEAARAITFLSQPGLNDKLSQQTIDKVAAAIEEVKAAILSKIPDTTAQFHYTELLWTIFVGTLATSLLHTSLARTPSIDASGLGSMLTVGLERK